MSSIDAEESILSEDTAEQAKAESLKLVPVAESIRYRKRAQSAEKKAEVLAEELAQAKSQAAKTAEQLNDIELEQKLTCKLAAAGAVDLETAVLIAKARMGGQEKADLDGVVEQLRTEKQYLFGGNTHKMMVMTQKTAAAKDGTQNSRVILEKAAKRAAATGNRTDLQEYLKLRRDFA